MEEEKVRLQKFLADQGIASRRKCEEYIKQGLVKVNGEVVLELGTKVDVKRDVVSFKGKELERKKEKKIYILLNKPIRICDNCKRSV